MILHLKDWAYYPNAMVHESTTNRSWYEVAQLYKSMGVKNYYFHLALINPDLEGIDPHHPYLTVQQMTLIWLECRQNPWYFWREVVRIPVDGSIVPEPLKANRGIICLFWLFLNNIDMVLIQPRQTGKTLGTCMIMLWLIYIGGRRQRINMLTKDETLRKSNIGDIKKYRNELPKFLNMHDPKIDADNQEIITCNTENFENRFTTAIAQKAEADANNILRGMTASVLWGDEFPFIPFMDIVFPSIMSTGNAARAAAKRNGGFYGSIFTTTAGKVDSRSGKFMYDLVMGGIAWNEALFDAGDRDTLENIVETGSKGVKPVVNATFSHRQLGYTDEWLVAALKRNNAVGDVADRDFFNRWTFGTSSSPLSTFLNEVIKKSAREPYMEITKLNYALYWYIDRHEIAERMATGQFVIGMDTSDGVGRDSCTLVMMDVRTLEVVMTLKCAEINLLKFGQFVADFMLKYKNTWLIPEKKQSGMSLIDTITTILVSAGEDPYRRVYNLIVDNKVEHEKEYDVVKEPEHRRPYEFYERTKRYFGYTTSGTGYHSRDNLYSTTLQTAARRGGAHVRDKTLIREITSLEVKNYRIDHKSGAHDDMVIAWLLGTWMLSSSKNLSFYGISGALYNAPDIEDNDAKINDDYFSEEENAKQMLYRDQLMEVLEKLRQCKDDILAFKYERHVKMLESQLKESYISDLSLDSLIADALEAREKFKRVSFVDRRYDTSQRRWA